MTYSTLDTNVENGLGRITFNRPPVNVLNMGMMTEIVEVLEDYASDKNIRAILIEGKGKCFSAGVDVGEHMGDVAPKMIAIFHKIFRVLDTIEVPTIASVHGSCLGGGCEVAIFCDMAIASESAKFGQPEIQVGVFPPIAALVMPRYIGRKAAMDLILSGRILSAADALQMGLVNKVVPDASLAEETAAFVKPYLKLSAEVLRRTKKAIRAGLLDDLDQGLQRIERIYLDELMVSHDAQEGLAAFLQKRKPVWNNA